MNEGQKKRALVTSALALVGTGIVFIVSALNKRANAMKISKNGLQIIKDFEGCRLTAYQDAVGVWTIGYGHTLNVKAGQTITQAEADKLIEDDVAYFAKRVSLLVGNKVNQNQFDALVSFAYNVGVGNLSTSTLLKKVLKNPSDTTIADEFKRWKYAGGKVLEGLVKRREREAQLYFA